MGLPGLTTIGSTTSQEVAAGSQEIGKKVQRPRIGVHKDCFISSQASIRT